MVTKPAGIILNHLRRIVSALEAEQFSDRELLQRFAQQRDEMAFATLVRRHGPMILHACQRVLHNWHDAEDAFQATFLILARKAASRTWDESVGSWLYLVAHRLALKIRASRDRHSQQHTCAAERSSDDPAAVASGRELSGVLDEELSRLPEKCRAALVLCSLEGFTRDQAARHLGLSLGTFRRRLEKGRALLRQRLVRRGLPVSAIFATVLGTEPAAQAALPPGLAQSAVQIAMGSGLGNAVPAALVSSRVAALADGLLKVMSFSKLKIALAAVLAMGIAGAGAGIALQHAVATKPADVKQPESPSSPPQAGGQHEPEQPRIASGSGQLTIPGRVLMPDGSPAAGAVVSSLGNEQGEATTVRTDSQGRFRLRGEFGMNCQLHARSADMNYQTTFRVSETLARKCSAADVEMKLTPAREHVVTVIAENAPVEGAQVAATGIGYKVHGVTDKDGKVRLRVPSGEPLQELVAWHPRLGAAGFRDVDHGIASASSNLALLAPAPHTIRVTDTEGRTVPNLRLKVSILTGMPNWILTNEIEAADVCTDASGNAICPWAPREFKAVNVEIVDGDAGNWKIDEFDRSKSAEGLTTIRVRRKIPVQGMLVMPPGVSGDGLLVAGYGFGPSKGIGDYCCTRANRDGSFTLRVPSDYGYALGVADNEWASDSWTGMILPDDKAEPAPITLNVYPAIPLTVHVTRGPQHQPVANAWIYLGNPTEFTFRRADGKKGSFIGGDSTWLQTNSNGVASAGLGKGKCRLRLLAGDWQEERTVQVTTQKSVSVDFDKPWLDKRKIAGRLFRDNSPHKPSTAIKIRAWATGDDERPLPVQSQLSSEPQVSPDGRFEIALDAREVSVLALDPEHRLSGFAKLHQNDSVLNLALAPTAVYSGLLVDAKRQPVAGKTLRLVVNGSETVADHEQITDAQGRFHFDHVATNVPLELQIHTEVDGRRSFYPFGKRFFLPGEKRENTTVVTSNNSSVAGTRPNSLKERLESLTRDARLSAMRVLVVLKGDTSKKVADAVQQLLDFEDNREILGYLPLVISPESIQADAATVAQLGWDRPQGGEIVLLAIDGDGRLGSQRVAIGDVDSAVQVGNAFVKQHAPPARDARVLLTEAQRNAKQTGRRVWIVFGGPRCGPCFRLARWMDDQHALLEKDYVVLKLGHDKGAWEAREELKQSKYGGIPWMAITQPDGTLLITSDGPLGNIGFPSGFEGLRHFREMLDRTAQRLTAEEREQLVRSLPKLEE